MKKLYTALLSTSMLFSVNAFAQSTVTTLKGLTDALAIPDANVVFDATGIQNVEGYLNITLEQKVGFENIVSWKNPDPQTKDINRIISSDGTLSIKNSHFNGNDLWIGPDGESGGGVIRNTGQILEISNSTFNNNDIKTDVFGGQKGGLWGGIIMNIGDTATIKVIKNTEFKDNNALSLKNAPHGTAIVNLNGSRIDLIDNVLFENNIMKSAPVDDNVDSGAHGGALENNDSATIGTISNTKFIGNQSIKQIQNVGKKGHSSGGAINTYNVIEKIENTLFERNAAIVYDSTAAAYGGAIKNTYANSSNIGKIGMMDKVDFIKNYVQHTAGEAYGGGIASNGRTYFDRMINVYFEKNYAQGDGIEETGKGGAFGGGIYQNKGNIGELNGEFFGNYAVSKHAKAQGGAIWNGGEINKIVDSKFIDNYASGKTESLGGAIYNTGTIGFEGTNLFKNNKTGDTFNDIHNEGTITVKGDLTLDGGITGSGDITFKDGASLTAELDKTKILANSVSFEGDNKLTLKINDNIVTKEYDFITASLSGIDNLKIAQNVLYDLSMTDSGQISVQKKSIETIEKDLTQKMDKEAAKIITAGLMTDGSGTNALETLNARFSDLIQEGDYKMAEKGAQELAPSNSEYVKELSKSLNTLLLNVMHKRVDSLGRSGGDVLNESAVWVKGIYNHAEKETTSTQGFDSNTQGIAFGIDGKVNDSTSLGLGYAYTKTDADIGANETEVDGHNFFAYAHYQPNRWYVDLMANFGQNQYTEKKSPLGVALRSEYDVNTYAVNLMTGYELENGFTPMAGLRYLSIHKDGYFDGVNKVSSDNEDILTGVIGSEYSYQFNINGFTVCPSGHLLATYDIISDESLASVNVLSGGSYQIEGEKLNRFGVEAGVGVSATLNNLDVSLDYLGGFKKDYQNHSGMIKATYHF